MLSTIGDQLLARIMFALSKCRLPEVVAFYHATQLKFGAISNRMTFWPM